jgi:hypothetical protein
MAACFLLFLAILETDRKEKGAAAAIFRSSSHFFFFIKCKNIIDKKGAGIQQYKEKGNKVL